MDFFHSPNFTCNKFIKNLTLILLLGKLFYIDFIAYPSNSCQGPCLHLVLVVRMEAVRVVILFRIKMVLSASAEWVVEGTH